MNNTRHSNRVVAETERRLRNVDPHPGQRLLDVGCGNGAAPIHISRTFGLTVIGVDVDPDQIQAAASAAVGQPDVHFQVADATALPFPGAEFDLVYTNKTTHHIRDWRRVVAEMARVLKPGGRLVYSDFAAPFGTRLPTRIGINTAAEAHGLRRLSRSGSPFHYTAVFEKPAPTSSAATKPVNYREETPV